MLKFIANIDIIGVNPFVYIPEQILREIFIQAGRNKNPVAVYGTIDGQPFIQTLVKYSGEWRLYLNMPMRKAAGKDVGDGVEIQIAFDEKERLTPMPLKLKDALEKNPDAFAIFSRLSPSMQKEIMRYINNLKTTESVERNVERAIRFLLGKDRFVGRDKL